MMITKALSDETRVRVLMALSNRELCVCQITELFKLAPSTVSRHLSILNNAGLVNARKDKRWVYYRIADSGVSGQSRSAIKWALNSLKHDKLVLQDLKRLSKVLKAVPDEVCVPKTKKTT